MRKPYATALAGGCMFAFATGASAEATRGPDLQATVSPAAHINFANLAKSPGNWAAISHLRPVTPLPRRLPNGERTNRIAPVAGGLPGLAANAIVAASSGGFVAISGFTGVTEGINAAANGSELEPPDQGLAVNNGIVGEIVNNTIQFYRSGQPITAPVANYLFFNSGTVASLSDPHITFDSSVQRWFVDELTYFGPLGFGIYLAVSNSSDPTGSWTVYFIPGGTSDLKGCGKSGCLPDYPQVGYDGNGFYITADLFGPRRFVSAVLYALPKPMLVAGTSFTPVRFTFPDFVVQPAVPPPGAPFSYANGGTEYFMTARNIYNGSTNIRVWELQNTFNLATAPETLVTIRTDLKAENYTGTVPSTEPNVIGPYGQSQQAKSAPLLDGGYNSFGANVKQTKTRLYAALTSGAMDSKGLARDIIAWFAVDIAGKKPRLVNQGYIVPPDGYSISYPGLALDKTGSGYIGVTITNKSKNVPGGFPSTAIVDFNGKTGAGDITVTGSGGTSDDGFTGYGAPHQPGQVGRWGDFASAVVDAVTGKYYTANEFIPDSAVYPRGTYANWGTYVTEIQK